MKKLVLIIIMVVATFIWYGFQSNGVKESTGSESSTAMPPKNFTGADLTGADLTGANLEGVSLDGVILCNTTMPDGTISNTSCKI
jgi:uncharacterized protein YjbI with pentapeptide repeats